MAPTITLSPGTADEVVLEPSKVVSTECAKIHTGVSDFRATVVYNPDLKDLRGSPIHIDDPDASYFFRGFFLRANDRVSSTDNRTDIEGIGIEHDLERNANEHTVTNTLIHDAIREYWSNNTGFTPTVTEQTADETTTGTQAQAASTNAEFESITSDIADDVPVAVQNDNIELLQTCFTTEGEDRDRDTGNAQAVSDTNIDGEASNNQILQLNDVGDTAEWDFTPGHRIPTERFGVRVRDADDPTGGAPAFSWYLVGPEGTENQIDTLTTTGVDLTTSWIQLGGTTGYDGNGYEGPDLEAGTTYTLKVEIDAEGSTDENYSVDVVAPNDSGGSTFTANYTFDNTVDTSNDTLSGPELYPEAANVELDLAPTTWNVTNASVASSWNDTSNQQRIQLQLPPGGAYAPSDGSENNTTSISTDFGSDAGTAIRGRVRFSRFATDTTTTPTQGDTGQILQSWEITFDGNDIPVYNETTLEGDDLAILQSMHGDGRMRFTATHADGAKNVNSYPTGTTQPTPDWRITGKNVKHDLGADYANHVTVRGARDSDGNRISTTVSDSAAISNFGQEHWDERRPDASTQVETDRVARQVLKEHLRESDVTAEREIPSGDVAPGWAYELTLQDGTMSEVPSEEVHYRASAGDVTGRVVFDVRATQLQEQLNSVDNGLTRTQLSF